MRTPAQIKNLRNVMSLTMGPVAFIFSDEDIDAWADTIQERFDNMSKHEWDIRVRYEENKDLAWSEIPVSGSKKMFCYMREIKARCANWLELYPKMLEIRINIVEEPGFYRLITRDEHD